MLATKKVSMTIDEKVYDDFCWYASRKGIKISTWVNVQMQNFVEEEKMIDEYRKEKKRS